MNNRMILLAVALLLLGAAHGQGGEMPPAPVQVATADVRPMAARILVPGTVVSRSDAEISAEVEGQLEWVADVGTAADQGEPVARIEDTVLELRRTELAAQVSRQEAQLGFLEREEQRLKQLEARNVAAKTQLDEIRSQRDMATGDLAVARARLAQIADQIERTVIRAPFPAVVVERLRQAGERVNVGTAVVRLVNPASLEVIARAPLDYMGFLKVGATVGMSVGGEQLEGEVRTMVAVGDENTHLFEVRVDVPGGSLPVGQTVRLNLPSSAERRVLSVPRDALVLRPQGIAVFVVGEDNKARRVEVTTGLAAGDRIEVIGAIEPGDEVIVRGNERLRDGQTVAVQDAVADDVVTAAPASG